MTACCSSSRPRPTIPPLPNAPRREQHTAWIALRAKLARPFADVLNERASRRDIAETPLTFEELGAFLSASAKIKSIRADSEHNDEVSLRPSPAGGARHALEIYLLIRHCEGLSSGAYHYDPQAHRLERATLAPKMLTRLMEDHPYRMLGTRIPQLTMYLSARIGRGAWKYEAIAYKLIHQDLGCLYQTFYLTATALDLAPCALGSIDTALLGEAFGIDWRVEPFVGGFTLGKS